MSIFAEPVLLVPMHVDALALGAQPSDESFQWTRLSPSYEKLQDDFFLGPELAGDPFDQAPPLPSGVHLHFRLPRVFSQGRQSEGNPLTFPIIPNRWLVQRIIADAGPRASHHAWLIRSDQLVSEQGVAWPSFGNGAVSVIRIGAADELNAPPGPEDKSSDLRLTAVGVGRAGAKVQARNLLFSAHYYASRTALGFHDELANVKAGSQLSYLVTGWFSHAEDDPLWLEVQKHNPARWNDLQTWLEERKWTCVESKDEIAPRRVLCHGFVRGLQWKGADYDYFRPLLNILRPSRPPQASAAGKPADAAIGETPAEALAAMLRDGEVEQDLLAALQEGLFEGGLTVAKLRCDLHSRRFDAALGGAVFALARVAETVSDQKQAAHTSSTLPAELSRRLNDLNTKQAEQDRAARTFEDCRLQLYMTWFLLTTELKRGEDADKIKALRQQLETVRDEFTKAEEALNKATVGTNALLPPGADEKIWTESDPGETAKFRVMRTPAPAFYTPREPAIALASPVVARRGTVERAEIECRPETRVLKSVSLPVRGGNEAIVTGEQVMQAVLGAAPATLDSLHLSLLSEALLLDPDNAERIAGLAKVPKGTGGFGEREFWQTGKFAGGLPDWISQFDRSGENPWIPLMLAWEVQWHPDKDSGVANPVPADAIRNRWSIGEDAELRPSAAGIEPGGDYRSRGQTLLLSGAVAALRDHLKEAAATAPLVSELTNQNVAVQSLNGFNAALVKRQSAVLLPALDWNRYSKREGLYIDPIQKELAPDEAALPFAPECREEFPPFQPVRVGNLKLLRLSIIDAFGQTIQLKTPDASPADFKLRAAHSCRGAADGEIVLQPRLLQPARLQFDWADPLCGWIVPNHLDQSFTVHDAEGRAVGLLQKRMEQLVGTADRAAFYWASAPGAETKNPDTIPDPHLRAFCAWALGLNPDAGAMLFSLINEQIDVADQRIPETDALLSIVIGRPFALALGSLRLQLAGPPTHPADARDSCGLEHVRLPVRLGDRRATDDGLIGFFLPKDGGFDKDAFFPAWRPTMAPMSEGLKERFRDQAELSIDCSQPLPLLVLMDPGAVLRVATGLLPVAVFRLPPDLSEGGRRTREAFFQTAPVLGFAEEPEMPRPSDDYGEWSWLWRPNVTSWKAADHLVEAAERGGFDDRWPFISEGWLKLRIEPLKLLSFWIQDADKPVARGSRPRLAWAQQGAERLELNIVSPREKAVKLWEKPPFPSAYAVEVQEQTTFELKATAGGIERSLQLVVQVQ
jgi:hypothetical protein